MLYSIQLVTHNDRGLVLLESKEAASYRGAMHCARQWANNYGQNTGTIRVVHPTRGVIWTHSHRLGRTHLELNRSATRAEMIALLRAAGVKTRARIDEHFALVPNLPVSRNLP